MLVYDRNNVFAKIISGSLPSDKVYEDEQVLAIKDMHPVAPVHILVLPKGDYISFEDFMAKADVERVAHFFATIRKIANDLGLEKTGYRLITNHGSDASQTVLHFHVHILGKKRLGGLIADEIGHAF